MRKWSRTIRSPNFFTASLAAFSRDLAELHFRLVDLVRRPDERLIGRLLLIGAPACTSAKGSSLRLPQPPAPGTVSSTTSFSSCLQGERSC